MHVTVSRHEVALDAHAVRTLRSTRRRTLLAACALASWLTGLAPSLHALEFTDPGGLCISVPDGWLSFPQSQSPKPSAQILKAQAQDGSVRVVIERAPERNTPREVDRKFVEDLITSAGGSVASYAERFVAVGHRSDFTFLTSASSQPGMGSVLWNGKVVYLALGVCGPKGDFAAIATVLASARLAVGTESSAPGPTDITTTFRSLMTSIGVIALIIVIVVIRKGQRRDAAPRVHRRAAPPLQPRSPPTAGRVVAPEAETGRTESNSSDP